MAVNVNAVREALKKVKFPGLSRDIVSFGFVKAVAIDGDAVKVEIVMTTGNAEAGTQVETDARTAVEALPGVGRVELSVEVVSPQAAAAPPKPSCSPA